MEYYSEPGRGKFWLIIGIVIIIGIIGVAWYFNSFNIREKLTEGKNKAIDLVDNRPRQLISQEPPPTNEYCVLNEFTNVVGWDELNNCCLYEWRGNDNILQTCITAQINGETIYSTYNGEYIENYEDYLSQVQ